MTTGGAGFVGFAVGLGGDVVVVGWRGVVGVLGVLELGDGVVELGDGAVELDAWVPVGGTPASWPGPQAAIARTTASAVATWDVRRRLRPCRAIVDISIPLFKRRTLHTG
ncbi:hypothetical protein N865_13795 [Intrasporangium oryzae NRRL B-24470]|uniref:Uncharacterized protein n=1 Tax=Intrasporangium oryzae NRRL B-24470 TaxID=1386089 RepID=W9G7G3_9MICO|nr:hypothetical protein [Intrasporangium oryzae]EWT00758.1 hypothetical protein N865_13795 [Intrasporangium oryzae NRRL B-24470]